MGKQIIRHRTVRFAPVNAKRKEKDQT